MLPRHADPERRLSISQRREERELLFWTARQSLRIVLLLAFTVYAIVAFASGHMPILDHLLPLLGR
jgi:hypothetical protein